MAFAAKLCTSSGVKLLRWLPDWLPTTTGFCCETLHQFWCETFTAIAWLTAYDLWLLLRNFAPVLVWNFYGDCLTDYLRLLAFAAKLCTSSGVKLLRWSLDWPRTFIGFCCETLHQFWCKTVTVIAWLTTYGYTVFAAKQKGPCLLSGVNVNDERGNHPPHVETRVKDCKRYLTLWARGFQPSAVGSFQRKAC